MSSLPPVGSPIITGEEPGHAPGQMEPGFGKNQIERRKGRSDRRAREQSAGGGRRVGEADRRNFTGTGLENALDVQRLQPSGETEKPREREPVHLEDDQGRLQPNPKAAVTGVSDIERLQDAVKKGVPLGTAEIQERGAPSPGVPVVHHVAGTTTERESGEVRAGIGQVDTSEAKGPSPEGTGEKLPEPGSEQARAEDLAKLGQKHVEEAAERSAAGGGLSDRELVDQERQRQSPAKDRRVAQRRVADQPVETDRREIADRRRMGQFSDQIGRTEQ